jgi:flagellar protein FlaG
MNPQQPQTEITLAHTADYRESYANSVQVRVSLWDFFLLFGTINQSSPDKVSISNFQGLFLSPQQAKALANVLNQNVQQYETAFGEIKLAPQASGGVIQ